MNRIWNDQVVARRTFLQGAAGSAITATGFARMVHGHGPEGKIKVGQIGTKHAHASGKMATMRKFRDLFEVVGCAEPDESQRQRVAETRPYRDVTWMTEQQLLETPGLEAVAVEAEVSELVPTAARCVAAGMHVHLDKPAGETLEPFEQLLEEATQRGLVVQMGYMFRYNPGFQFLFQAVRDGWLGEVFEVHGVMSKTVGSDARRQLAAYAGGSMFELGCHLVDALVTVLGKPDRVMPFNRRTREDDLLDNCLAVLEYPRATATVRSTLVEVDGARRRQFIVCGDRGTVELKPLEPPRLELTLDRPREPYQKGKQTVDLPRLEGRYDGDFRDLARIIRGEKATDYPPAHDLAVHQAVLRASGLPMD